MVGFFVFDTWRYLHLMWRGLFQIDAVESAHVNQNIQAIFVRIQQRLFGFGVCREFAVFVDGTHHTFKGAMSFLIVITPSGNVAGVPAIGVVQRGSGFVDDLRL